MIINTAKLTQELLDAGIPCTGCNSEGAIFFTEKATDDDEAKAKEILGNYVDEEPEISPLAEVDKNNDLDFIYQIFQYLSDNKTDLGTAWQDWQNFRN